MEILTLDQLRGIRCQCNSPDCTGEIFFHATCHPESGTWTSYDGDHHWLTIACAQCDTKIARILLPSSPANSPDSNTGGTL
jgi:hypothetical protein